MIGHTIFQYKILSKLDEGEMGVVHKAEDIKLKRFIALRVLAHAAGGDARGDGSSMGPRLFPL